MSPNPSPSTSLAQGVPSIPAQNSLWQKPNLEAPGVDAQPLRKAWTPSKPNLSPLSCLQSGGSCSRMVSG